MYNPSTNKFPETCLRLNRICPYFTRFPLQFPLTQLCDAHPGQGALDPFCGAGTTLFAARLKGLHAVGVDSNPVAVAIARAKMQRVTPEVILDKATHILGEREAVPLPEGAFWEQCYTPDTLEALCRFRSYFMSAQVKPVDVILRALLMGLLHGPNTDDTPRFFSNHLAADFAPLPEEAIAVWKEHHLQPPVCNVREMIQHRAAYLLAKPPDRTTGLVKKGDSRKVQFSDGGQLFDWIITSPPYYGMDSYPTDQWLRNWFLGGPTCPETKTNSQISQKSPKVYVYDLAKVWKRITPFCNPGARLIVRIGNVPGIAAPPAVDLFQTSLNRVGSGWKIENSVSVRRNTTTQKSVSAFGPPALWPENEMEVFARLTS